MSNFNAKATHEASLYLQEKLKTVKNGYKPFNPATKNAYILEDKKASMFQRFVGSIFHK